MKGKRHTEEQIVGILKQSEAGMKTAEVCRQAGVSEQTFYRWKSKYGGMEASDAKRLRQLEDENRRLKHLLDCLQVTLPMRRAPFLHALPSRAAGVDSSTT